MACIYVTVGSCTAALRNPSLHTARIPVPVSWDPKGGSHMLLAETCLRSLQNVVDSMQLYRTWHWKHDFFLNGGSGNTDYSDENRAIPLWDWKTLHFPRQFPSYSWCRESPSPVKGWSFFMLYRKKFSQTSFRLIKLPNYLKCVSSSRNQAPDKGKKTFASKIVLRHPYGTTRRCVWTLPTDVLL